MSQYTRCCYFTRWSNTFGDSRVSLPIRKDMGSAAEAEAGALLETNKEMPISSSSSSGNFNLSVLCDSQMFFCWGFLIDCSGLLKCDCPSTLLCFMNCDCGLYLGLFYYLMILRLGFCGFRLSPLCFEIWFMVFYIVLWVCD